jgi:hypothetical protein
VRLKYPKSSPIVLDRRNIQTFGSQISLNRPVHGLPQCFMEVIEKIMFRKKIQSLEIKSFWILMINKWETFTQIVKEHFD